MRILTQEFLVAFEVADPVAQALRLFHPVLTNQSTQRVSQRIRAIAQLLGKVMRTLENVDQILILVEGDLHHARRCAERNAEADAFRDKLIEVPVLAQQEVRTELAVLEGRVITQRIGQLGISGDQPVTHVGKELTDPAGFTERRQRLFSLLHHQLMVRWQRASQPRVAKGAGVVILGSRI